MYNFLIIINKVDNKIKSKFEISQELELVPFYYFQEKMPLWNTYLWLKIEIYKSCMIFKILD